MIASFYQGHDGFFNKVHPVTKLLALIVSFVPPFLAERPSKIVPYLMLLLLTVIIARAWASFRKLLPLMLLLIVMSLLLWVLFSPGRTIWLAIGPLSIKKEGLTYGLTVGLRLDCFILAALVFLASTPIEDFTYALYRLGLPYGPSFVLTLAFRLTPLFIETGQTIALAQKARGLDLESGGPLTKLRRYAPIIIPILISGLRRGDQLAMALETRGFGRTRQRTFLTNYSWGWRDLAVLTTVLLAVVLM